MAESDTSSTTTLTSSSTSTAFDVIIIGAGLAGINAAYRLQTQLPHLSYAILEARDNIGGTWDLFRYPGIRSDSDLFTFGFAWQPWNQPTPIGEGAAILNYLKQTAAQYGIDQRVHLRRRLQTASWSSAHQVWTLTVNDMSEDNGEKANISYTARFVILCTGYYDYHKPLETIIPGLERFQGQIVHPQFWPENLDYTDKQVVVIGSGATAITLIPKLAEKAARTTMLQRSPSYILSIPNNRSKRPSWLEQVLSPGKLHAWKRMSFLLWSRFIFLFCKAFPDAARRRLRRGIEELLPPHLPYDPHFNPRYNPWDQRVCLTPNGDFFNCLHDGRADVKTGTIKDVVADGILMTSNDSSSVKKDILLPADIIITATGLKLQLAGAATFDVDGVSVVPSEKFFWNGAMLQDVPNLSIVIGYTSISWTLGVDATAQLICRLLRIMERKRLSSATPRVEQGIALTPKRLFNISSTYVTVAESHLPKAGDQGPWRPRTNYISDYWFVKLGRVERGLQFVPGEGVKLKEKAS
ncbi:FAD/NAD(P)-binding domain-containing protein [Xylona heveae TC161]|uniref:FAD/NAD(P)-binding domain-containing protein n=1 Tax=Xylona heveae (strain CBS 132557 / TC161) TaxID=1328760 RepID=A0A165FHH6_XYLHT|nr:FAD/NAD(P)-binding domain-containing protein [Xylona heveae TC161]KZF20984.1 FAD/NAD(P)-binding domain-containing protein [Xylona heveae TC161]